MSMSVLMMDVHDAGLMNGVKGKIVQFFDGQPTAMLYINKLIYYHNKYIITIIAVSKQSIYLSSKISLLPPIIGSIHCASSVT